MNGAAPPFRLNVLLAGVALVWALVQLFVVPLLLLPQAPGTAAVLIALLCLATPFNTAVLHEAIHGRLASRPVWNDRIARTLAICSGVSFDVLRFGHLTHHRFNRHAFDRPDVIEPGQTALRAGLGYYAHLLGGLFLFEVLASLAMLLPRIVIERLLNHSMSVNDPAIAAMRRAARRGIDRRLGRVRFDVAAAILLYAGAFALYGEWWPILVLAVALRGLIVSLQDNLPHYGTPPVIGADAHDMGAPRWAAAFMLNQNLHAVHHERPELPWTALPRAFEERGQGYSAAYFGLLLRQFRGPRRARPAG